MKCGSGFGYEIFFLFFSSSSSSQNLFLKNLRSKKSALGIGGKRNKRRMDYGESKMNEEGE